MSRQSFIINAVLVLLTLSAGVHAFILDEKTDKKRIVISSQTLTADNKNNTATFEGSVVAESGDIAMYSDKMTVYYNASENKIKRIHALGNVKVHRKERALFSDEAMYMDDEEKIIFTGHPRAVEGDNVITGRQIIFYLKDDRAVVEQSRVILQNSKGLN